MTAREPTVTRQKGLLCILATRELMRVQATWKLLRLRALRKVLHALATRGLLRVQAMQKLSPPATMGKLVRVLSDQGIDARPSNGETVARPSDAETVVPDAPKAAGSAETTGSAPNKADLARTCGGLAPGLNDFPVDRITAAMSLTDEQLKALDALKAALPQASRRSQGILFATNYHRHH